MTRRVATILSYGGTALAALSWAALAFAELAFFFSPFSYLSTLWVTIPFALFGAIGVAVFRVAERWTPESPSPNTAEAWIVSLALGLIPGVVVIVGVYLLRGQ